MSFHYLHIQRMKKDGFTMNANVYKIVKGNILKVSGTYHQVYVECPTNDGQP